MGRGVWSVVIGWREEVKGETVESWCGMGGRGSGVCVCVCVCDTGDASGGVEWTTCQDNLTRARTHTHTQTHYHRKRARFSDYLNAVPTEVIWYSVCVLILVNTAATFVFSRR